ncbi:MAG: FAD-binding oxidoreductase [Proteobacteria bacterium]|nr:FAD-binding oxidoreductase [Pseudomonadota bacterium]
MGTKEDLIQIVGSDNVVTDKCILETFRSDLSFHEGETPEYIVKPKSFDEVQRIVWLANEKGFPLVPCSSGGERFKGTTIPETKGAVVVDFSSMKKIVRVDRRNKVAMVEPGVTFAELQAAVEKEGLRLEMPLLPKPEKSVVASLLEREPTTCPKYNWDAIDPLCCLELVLGTGDKFVTGNAAGPGTLEQQWAAKQAQKVSMGPAQTDIGRIIQGSQGTLGLATWATIKLEVKPSIQKCYLVPANDLEDLIMFTYKMLWRKLPDHCLILNNINLSAITGVDHSGLPPWVLVYTISGLEYFPEDRISYMEEEIYEMASGFNVQPVQKLGGVSGDKLIGLLNKPGKAPYWKQSLKGGVKELFFLTTLDKSSEFVTIMHQKAVSHNFPKENTGIYIQPIRHGTGCHMSFNLMADFNNAEEKDKVKILYDDAGKAFLEMGGFFSRPHGTLVDAIYSKCPDTVLALKKVKNIFDPKGVMNPGKLCFGEEV